MKPPRSWVLIKWRQKALSRDPFHLYIRFWYHAPVVLLHFGFTIALVLVEILIIRVFVLRGTFWKFDVNCEWIANSKPEHQTQNEWQKSKEKSIKHVHTYNYTLVPTYIYTTIEQNNSMVFTLGIWQNEITSILKIDLNAIYVWWTLCGALCIDAERQRIPVQQISSYSLQIKWKRYIALHAHSFDVFCFPDIFMCFSFCSIFLDQKAKTSGYTCTVSKMSQLPNESSMFKIWKTIEFHL